MARQPACDECGSSVGTSYPSDTTKFCYIVERNIFDRREQMAKGEHLGELEALVLTGVVRVGPSASGPDVFEELEARSRRAVSLPSIHVTLRRLEDKGLLRSTTGSPPARGGRPSREYRLTDEGIWALSEFRDMWRRVWRDFELPDSEAVT